MMRSPFCSSIFHRTCTWSSPVRVDPLLPLARLRGLGALTELRISDLRFTFGEATAFLIELMALQLGPSEVAALEARTEGWIAGLHLAALSMQGRDDLAGFIKSFTGSSRYLIDYLAEEVLLRQPEAVQHFLVHTSILDRLSNSLCDAVRGKDDSQALLAHVERANLFLVPLDDERLWYRYHHLLPRCCAFACSKRSQNCCLNCIVAPASGMSSTKCSQKQLSMRWLFPMSSELPT